MKTVVVRCLDSSCEAKNEVTTCVDCGNVTYDGPNCGHVYQPTAVSGSEINGDPVCDECEEKRHLNF